MNDVSNNTMSRAGAIARAERYFDRTLKAVLARRVAIPSESQNPQRAAEPLRPGRVDPAAVLPALRRHLDRHGFPMVEIAQARDEIFYASLLDPEHPWVQWTVASMTATSGRRPGCSRAPADRYPTMFSPSS
jgi:hypothetical protein